MKKIIDLISVEYGFSVNVVNCYSFFWSSCSMIRPRDFFEAGFEEKRCFTKRITHKRAPINRPQRSRYEKKINNPIPKAITIPKIMNGTNCSNIFFNLKFIVLRLCLSTVFILSWTLVTFEWRLNCGWRTRPTPFKFGQELLAQIECSWFASKKSKYLCVNAEYKSMI